MRGPVQSKFVLLLPVLCFGISCGPPAEDPLDGESSSVTDEGESTLSHGSDATSITQDVGDTSNVEETTSEDANETSGEGETSSDDDATSTGDTGDDDDDGNVECKLGPWVDNRTDKRLASQDPPCGLKPEQVPMFVVLGWDDQENLEGLQWSLDLTQGRTNPDGSDIHFTYYNTTFYVSESGAQWKAAMDGGHEMGNHTDTHNEGKVGATMTVEQWESELSTCEMKCAEVGIEASSMYGVRAPRLEQWDSLFEVVQDHGYWYDCSLAEGMQSELDGTNFYWPYTLDEGSPGDIYADWDYPLEKKYPGLWELPVYEVVVPSDADCEKYGTVSGLRQRIKDQADWFELDNPKFTGFDYNLMFLAKLNAADYLAILKYTFDLRMQGNRAPFLFGTHSGQYADSKSIPGMTPAEARGVIEEFLDYVLTHEDVRVVSAKEALDWIRNPEAL